LEIKTVISLLLTGTLLLPLPGYSQDVSGPKSNVVAESGGLKIAVVKGDGAVNNIRARTATAPVVVVRDQNDKPIVGAEVVFQLPAAGPGAVFHGWMRTQTARTDAEGMAAASGMVPNEEAGRFNIKVTATDGKRTASLVVAQSNAIGGAANGKQARGSRKALYIILGVAAAAAIGGGIAATRNGDSSTAAVTNPITITPGAVTVAGPK